MQANTLRSAHGWNWLREGLQLWRKNPALLSFAAFGYLLALLVVSIFPFVGQIAASLIMPALSVGVLNACRAIDAGRKIGPDVLFSGFRSNLPSLLAIGGLYLAGSVLILLVVSMVDDGTLAAIMRGGGDLDEAALSNSNLGTTLLVGTLLSTPLMMAYWFAPMLASWWKLPAAKAMFFSFMAVLRNKGAFVVYALSWFGVAFAASFVVRVLNAMLGDSPVAMSMVLSPLSLILISAVYCSFWPTYRDAVVDARIQGAGPGGLSA